jgi:hypothetical protein
MTRKHHLFQVFDRGEWVYVTGYDEHGQLFVTKSREEAEKLRGFFPRYCSKAIFEKDYPDKQFRYEP